ncbi:MAG: hypothetical protein DSY33_00710 [Archaeoglobus sp.]|jgi:uncharacterized Zn finger protein|nr:MAG: hypothetical protein DSY33_00710 [Archaeoglobus sp.]
MKIYCDVCCKETEHKLIRADRNLYKCRICGSVVELRREKEIELRAIISSGATSEKGKIRLRPDDLLKVGDEVVVEVGEGFKVGEITSLEFNSGLRVDLATAREVSTVWLRDTGEVTVKISLHKGSITTPYRILVSGETKFEVGEILEINRKNFKITRIKLINGRLLRKDGDIAVAKEIKRVYAIYQPRKPYRNKKFKRSK